MNEKLEALIKEYVAKGIPPKMAKMLAQAKLKKTEGGEGKKDRFKQLMKK